MPVYEYRCPACDTTFEKKQSFDAERYALCPNCRDFALRIMSKTNFILKGEGWSKPTGEKK
jgi:putative FmdB family regulatory protein